MDRVTETSSAEAKRVVWDLPVRLTHWLIAALVLFSWWTSEINNLQWHSWSGYALLVLIIFRVYWGFFGSSTARFSHFLKGPKAIFSYAKQLFSRSSPATVGHNPLGALSAIALWLVLLIQIVLGLFSEDVDGLASGPMSYMVSFDTGRWAAQTHDWMFNVLLLFIGLHIAAVLFYLVYKKHNLITPMITGRRSVESAEAPRIAPLWQALVGLVLAGALVWALLSY